MLVEPPVGRLSLRKIKDVLRLTHDVYLNTRQVALGLHISRSTVTNYQGRAQKGELSWPLPEDLTEEAVGARTVSAASGGPSAG